MESSKYPSGRSWDRLVTIKAACLAPSEQSVALQDLTFSVEGKKTPFMPIGGIVFSVFSKAGVSLGSFGDLREPIRLMRQRGPRAGHTLSVSVDYRPRREYWHLARIKLAEFDRREYLDLVVVDGDKSFAVPGSQP